MCSVMEIMIDIIIYHSIIVEKNQVVQKNPCEKIKKIKIQKTFTQLEKILHKKIKKKFLNNYSPIMLL